MATAGGLHFRLGNSRFRSNFFNSLSPEAEKRNASPALAMSSATAESDVSVLLQNVVRKELAVKALIQDIQDVVADERDLERTHRQVQKTISEIRVLLDEMAAVAQEQDREDERAAAMNDVKEHTEQVARLQQMLRKANVTAQVAVERSAREHLLQPEATASARRRIMPENKEGLMKMSSGVTSELLSISRSLAVQVKQSEDTLQTLVQSSKVTGDTQEEFKAMGGVILQSRKLLSKYNRREFTDKVLICLALAFFFACVFYVITKRAL